MQNLIAGIHQFQRDQFSEKQQLFEKLAGGQHPSALFITCSDSRIDPNLLTQADPGELFVLRNAGNLVPRYEHGACGESATIEYAVNVLKVNEIIICGHSHCGAMQGLLNLDSLSTLPMVKDWLVHAEHTRSIIDENYSHLEDASARLMTTVEENVLVQLENLRTHPCVAKALEDDSVNLRGWVYKFETGDVFAYSPDSGQFESLGESNPPEN